MNEKTYKATCFCGAVELSLIGDPIVSGYCHCDSCKKWSAAPVSTFTLWSPDAVIITKGEDNILTYNKTERSYRKSCKICGGHLLNEFKPMALLDIYADVISGFTFDPVMHVFYEESVLSIKDGLPKFKDLPEEAGGSGEQLPE